ncbi:MAG: GNAT family N-acetyltransferase [Thermoplasmata archaeon]|jgi:ribosomal-protein-alanine N-acetyltransferase|nr:GNAT family N-acetyltransferase [Thermoplasmata archaeon]
MITIRAFSPTDIPHVMDIVKRSLGETYPPSLYLTIHNLWPEGFLVAIEDGRIEGFVATVPSGQKVARVLMLAVLPEVRGKSLGRNLMEQLYASCSMKGYDTVILEVRKSNGDAMAFYEFQGFSVTGEIGNFYSNGEDAYKMMKVLRS